MPIGIRGESKLETTAFARFAERPTEPRRFRVHELMPRIAAYDAAIRRDTTQRYDATRAFELDDADLRRQLFFGTDGPRTRGRLSGLQTSSPRLRRQLQVGR